jgi:hypothetical protein
MTMKTQEEVDGVRLSRSTLGWLIGRAVDGPRRRLAGPLDDAISEKRRACVVLEESLAGADRDLAVRPGDAWLRYQRGLAIGFLASCRADLGRLEKIRDVGSKLADKEGDCRLLRESLTDAELQHEADPASEIKRLQRDQAAAFAARCAAEAAALRQEHARLLRPEAFQAWAQEAVPARPDDTSAWRLKFLPAPVRTILDWAKWFEAQRSGRARQPATTTAPASPVGQTGMAPAQAVAPGYSPVATSTPAPGPSARAALPFFSPFGLPAASGGVSVTGFG